MIVPINSINSEPLLIEKTSEFFQRDDVKLLFMKLTQIFKN